MTALGLLVEPALSAVFDLELARGAASFCKLERDVVRLLSTGSSA